MIFICWFRFTITKFRHILGVTTSLCQQTNTKDICYLNPTHPQFRTKVLKTKFFSDALPILLSTWPVNVNGKQKQSKHWYNVERQRSLWRRLTLHIWYRVSAPLQNYLWGNFCLLKGRPIKKTDGNFPLCRLPPLGRAGHWQARPPVGRHWKSGAATGNLRCNPQVTW